MTDEEMVVFLGFEPGEPKAVEMVKGLSPAKRALFERMATLEIELQLWEQGLGPKPQGVLIDLVKAKRR